MSIIRDRRLKGGDHHLTISWEGKRVVARIGRVGSFFYARLPHASMSFDFAMHCFAECHVWMTENGWRPGKHEQHPPAVVQGGITKNWSWDQ